MTIPTKNKEYKREYDRLYYQANREKILARGREYIHRKDVKVRHNAYRRIRNYNLKVKALTYYGGGKLACVHCEFNDIRALSIDHIDGGGTVHRKTIGGSGNLYYWLIQNNYPNGYQTLCMNCQSIKQAKRREYGAGRNPVYH